MKLHKVRITYFFDDGNQLSVVEDWEVIDFPELVTGKAFGEWEQPFPNERGNSLAFGLNECFEQSDVGGATISKYGGVKRIKIEAMGERKDWNEDIPIYDDNVKPEIPPECKNCGAWGSNCNDCPANGARLKAIRSDA